MANDGQAFNKVKNLLNRMDRSIDEARDRRLGKGAPEGPMIGVASAPATGAATLIGAAHTPSAQPTPPIPQPAPQQSAHIGIHADTPENSKSGYGRAKPLARNQSSTHSTPESTRRWGT